MPQTTAAKPAENPRTRYLDSLTLADALWWFIENMAPDNPDRSDLFFYLRSRFRSERQPAPLTFGAALWLFDDSTIAQMHHEAARFAADPVVDDDLLGQGAAMRDELQKQADMRGDILTDDDEASGYTRFAAALDTWAAADRTNVENARAVLIAAAPSGVSLRPDDPGRCVNVHRFGESNSLALFYLCQPRAKNRDEGLTRAAWAAIRAIANATKQEA